MKQTIKLIIDAIPSGHIFDAHMVIAKLLQEYSNVYISNCNQKTIDNYHSNIAKIIDSFDGVLITRLDSKSWSKNLKDNFSPCTCWKKN